MLENPVEKILERKMIEMFGRCIRAALTAYLTVALLLTASSAGETDAKALASAVDEHYNHLRSLQAEFTEVYRGSGIEGRSRERFG